MKKVILASGSPRRKELLTKAGISFTVEVSNFDEYMDTSIFAYELAKNLSSGKAEAVAEKHSNEEAIILAADTIVVLDNMYLGKPNSYADASHMLQLLRGKMHKVVSGFSIIDLPSHGVIRDSDEARVYFKPFSDELIEEYLVKNTYMDKAGSYAIQELDERYIDHIEGDEETIIGLPTKKVLTVLSHLQK